MVDYRNILVVGGGGREHCLGWKISQSPKVNKVFFAPGNGGTGMNVPISPNDLEKLSDFARDNSCFTIVGPEKPLSLGIVDLFARKGLPIIGPTQKAARLESSKVFAKKFMKKYSIPTAPFSVFSNADDAKQFVTSLSEPPVIKVDGLAQGKGVIVCHDLPEAIRTIDKILKYKEFGSLGNSIVVEKRLYGNEVSFIALCDGHSIVPLDSSQDHKNVWDGDNGPNTGGMGAYSPAPIIDEQMNSNIMKTIMEPTLNALKKSGLSFKGFLYAGLMIERSTNVPYVLEFNVRLGDPECQSILTRMDSDLVEYLEAMAETRLASISQIKWKKEHAVCVVMTSKGYPGKYEEGKVVRGLNSSIGESVYIFHSGTARDRQDRIITAGGRVLSVTALGTDIETAIDRAYSTVRNIHWGDNEEYYRKDIGYKALNSNNIKSEFQ
jgi:phosphoribosylamine---glycine ligase